MVGGMGNIVIPSYRRQLLDKDLEEYKHRFTGRVLDIGGGTKRGSFKRPEGEGIEWIVLDNNLKHRPDILADAQHLPIKDGVIRAIKCTEVLEYLSSPEQAVLELCRVLEPKGTMVVSMPFNTGIHYDGDYVRYTHWYLQHVFMLNETLGTVSIKRQGAYFTVLCYMLKQAVLNTKSRTRWLLYWTFPILDLITKLDNCDFVKQSMFLSSYTTGYFVIARKSSCNNKAMTERRVKGRAQAPGFSRGDSEPLRREL